MKTIDFTRPGGFPLTQDQLAYLQSAYKEALNALAQTGGTGPVVVNGCTITKTLVSGTTYNYAITAGWIFYQDNLIRVNASALSAVNTSTNEVHMQLTPAGTPLTYYDGSSPSVVNDISGSLTSLPLGNPANATHFPLSGLQPYGREPVENVITVSTAAAAGGVSGTLYYRKNFLTNTLQIRGVLGAGNAQNFASAASLTPYLLCTLPAQYASKSGKAYFSGDIKFISTTRIKDDLGISWIERIVLSLDTNSNIYAYYVKPETSVSGYPLEINCIIPLD